MSIELLLLLSYAAPVALAALGETLTQRAGVINIGLEGAMLVSAFVAVLVAQSTKNPYVAFAAGGASGMVVCAVFALITVKLASDQVVVGTAINLLGLGVTSTLYRVIFGQSGQLLSVPKLDKWYGFDLGLGLLAVSVPLLGWVISKSAWGLAVRSAGEYPKAAEAAGFSVDRLRIAATTWGGLLGGLGGAYLSLGISGGFAENMTSGRGFVAIAMVTFGRWNPIGVFAAAALIGVAESLQFRAQTLKLALPYQFFTALPYLLALAVLVIVGKGSVAPKALGQTYRRNR